MSKKETQTYYIVYLFQGAHLSEWHTEFYELPYKLDSIDNIQSLREAIAAEFDCNCDKIKIINWSEVYD